MNKTDKAAIAKDFRHFEAYATQLSNGVYNIGQHSEDKRLKDILQTVRQYDAARNKLNGTLKRFGIV